MNGAISQKYRGPVGIVGSTTPGYNKNYNYDDRLQVHLAAAVPRPGPGGLVVQRQTIDDFIRARRPPSRRLRCIPSVRPSPSLLVLLRPADRQLRRRRRLPAPPGESWVTGRSRCDGAARPSRLATTCRWSRGCCSGAAAGLRRPDPRPLSADRGGPGFPLRRLYLVLRDGGPARSRSAASSRPLLAVITLTDLERRIIPNSSSASARWPGSSLAAVGRPAWPPRARHRRRRRRGFPA